MSQFIRGRRTIGVVALVMALALTGGWARSQNTLDVIVFPGGKQTTFLSCKSSVIWAKSQIETSQKVSRFPKWTRYPGLDQLFFNDPSFKVLWKWYGFSGGIESTDEATNDVRSIFWIIPYWAIIIPLTLFSANFLLRKPNDRSTLREHDDRPRGRFLDRVAAVAE